MSIAVNRKDIACGARFIPVKYSMTTYPRILYWLAPVLWLAWGAFCFSALPYRLAGLWYYPRLLLTTDMALRLMLFLLPLTLRPLFVLVQHVSRADNSFYLKRAADGGLWIHLSPLAPTRTPAQLRAHWGTLLDLIAQALDETGCVCMASHLFTPPRLRRLVNQLQTQKHLHVCVTRSSRKTPLTEMAQLSVIYLLMQWRLPRLHHVGATVCLTSS